MRKRVCTQSYRSWDCSCHDAIVMACPISALSAADVNKVVEIKNSTLLVNGAKQLVNWREAKHADSNGKIVSVNGTFMGTVEVKLDTGKLFKFENPASKDDKHPFDTDCYRSKLCHSPKVCQSWKSAVCTGAPSRPLFIPCCARGGHAWYILFGTAHLIRNIININDICIATCVQLRMGMNGRGGHWQAHRRG